MLKKIFSYGVIEGVSKGLNKLTLLLLPLFISTIDYGKIGLLVSLEVLLPLLSFLGLERGVLRFYNERQSHPSFLGSINTPIAIVHVGLLLFTALAYFLGYRTFFGISLLPDIFLIIILVYFQGANNLILNALRVDENHKGYYKGRVLIQVLKFIFTIGFVALSKSYLGYLIGAILSSIIANIICMRGNPEINLKGRYNPKTFKFLLLFSWPFVFHGFSNNLLGNADKFIIERLMDIENVGKYTFAYSLGTIVSFAYLGISVFIEPMVYKEESARSRESLLNKFVLYALSIGSVVFIGLSIVSQYILPKYFQQYSEVLFLIPLTSLCYLLIPFYFKSNYKLVYLKQTKKFAIMSIISCVFNIVLNIILIPKYGLFAGIISTFASFFIQGTLFNYAVEKTIFNRDFLCFIILSLLIFIIILLKLPLVVSILLIAAYICLYYYIWKMAAKDNLQLD